MTDRPDPLVPPEVDLRGLDYMPLLGGRLYTSDFDLDATDAEFRVALRLWWAAWNQVPAGSLPSEDRRIAKLAGLDEAPAKWKKVRERALHGFIECADGRLYHPVIAQQALIAWEKRVDDTAKRDAEAERKRREREERSRMFEQLRAVGVTPAWNAGTTELRTLIRQHVTPPVTRTGHDDSPPPVTRTVMAKTGRDGTGQEEPRAATNVAARVDLIARLKAARVFPDSPALLDPLIAAGVGWDEFEPHIDRALKAAKPFRFLVAIVAGERQRAAETVIAGKPEEAWDHDRSTMNRRAAELGVEDWDAFERRHIDAGLRPDFARWERELRAAHEASTRRAAA